MPKARYRPNFRTKPLLARQPASRPRELFRSTREVMLNPNRAQLRAALARVQEGVMDNVLNVSEVLDINAAVKTDEMLDVCVWHGGDAIGKDDGFTTTVCEVVWLFDNATGCVIERRYIRFRDLFSMPTVVCRKENPLEWHQQVLFWFRGVLNDTQIDFFVQQQSRLEQEIVGDKIAGRAEKILERNALRRERQRIFDQLGGCNYVPELRNAVDRIADELQRAQSHRISWREFQARWPSVATRYRNELVRSFAHGQASITDLRASFPGENPANFRLDCGIWMGAMRTFDVPQLLVRVCSPLVEHPTLGAAGYRSVQFSGHPKAPQMVGWLRVHIDASARLVFVDEVQSDFLERLRRIDGEFDGTMKPLEDWHVHGFSSLRSWATSIGYRMAMHSEISAGDTWHFTKSRRKWNTYYGTLIKRFGLKTEAVPGFPHPIQVEPPFEALSLAA